MSARALQQIAVRMHHDPQFVTQVYDDPGEVLAAEDLKPEEWRFLVQPDRRAWGADADRRQRVLRALELEFPASCTLAEQATRDRECLLAFFGSDEFHQCVRNFEPLVFAFGTYLVERSQGGLLGGREVTSVARLELAAARLRRVASPGGDGAATTFIEHSLRTSRWAEALELPEGTLKLLEAVRHWRETGGEVQFPTPSSERRECIVLERSQQASSLSIGYLPAPLFAILQLANEGASREELLSCARAEGAEAGEDEDVLRSLERDGLLVPHQVP